MENLERRLESLALSPISDTGQWAPTNLEQAEVRQAMRSADVQHGTLQERTQSAHPIVQKALVSEFVDEQTIQRTPTSFTHPPQNQIPSFQDAVFERPKESSRVASVQRRVAEAYAAVHGHPLEHDDRVSSTQTAIRWKLSVRSGAALLLLVLLCSAFALVVHQWQKETQPQELPFQGASRNEDAGVDAQMFDSDNHVAINQNKNKSGANPTGMAEQLEVSTPSTKGPELNAEIVVHVAGSVKKPGVYTLQQSSRVNDAVEAAGGSRKLADLNQLNLARPLVDGEQVYVPEEGEQLPNTSTQSALTETEPALQDEKPINVNTASSEELQSLPGVGPAIASRIIDFREAHGGFASVQDLESVPGIGPAMMAKIQNKVSTQ